MVQREREAAARMKEMEEYLDLRALQARQVLLLLLLLPAPALRFMRICRPDKLSCRTRA
jgi:hypothetical protein